MFQDEPSLSEYALDGLRQVMAVKSRVVLPFLVPQVSPNNAVALPQSSRILNNDFCGLCFSSLHHLSTPVRWPYCLQ